jgi:geranylgeranylglycerol-phosphate geranylgeranyltransferase
VAGGYIAGAREVQVFVIPVLLTALITGAGNVINDYFDIQIDRINKPRRPLPSERLSPREAVILYVVLSVGVVAGSFVIRPVSLGVLMIVWQVLLFLYAYRLKRVFVAGNLLVAAVAASAFFAGAIVGGDPASSAIPFAIAFGFVLSREVVKGCEDVEGDGVAGVRTAAVVLGVGRAGRLSAAMMSALALLFPLPAVVGVYGSSYLWIMLLLVVPLLFGGAWMVFREPCRRVFNRVSWMLKIGMFFGIVALAVG